MGMDINIFKDKYLFVDFDGTLCEYRYNNHVSGNSIDKEGRRLGGQSLNELLFDNCFERARPLKTMIDFLMNFNPDRIYILGAIVTFNEIKQKLIWLKSNCPFIREENIIFVADLDLKVDTLKEYSKHLNIPYNKIVLIDDSHSHIRKAEEAGFIAYHTTSFMA